MRTYPLKVENLPKHITHSEVRDFLDGPSADILENIEIYSNGSTSTAILVLTRPDVAYEFLNLKETEIDGNRITLTPELIEETSITLNGSWLREFEDENPAIQVEIQKIADHFQLKLDFCKSEYRETISLTGAPWRIEQAKATFNYKFQAIIKNRSPNVQKGLHRNPFQADAAGIQSAGDKRSGQSRNVDNLHATNEQGKPAFKLSDQQSSGDPISDLDKKGSNDLDNINPGKKRQRILRASETKSEGGQEFLRQSSNAVDKDQPNESKRTRVLVPKPEETQKSESSADALDKSTPVTYQASTQYQKLIRVEIDIHRYLLEHSTCLDFTDCSVRQIPVSERQMDWVIGSNYEEDLRMTEKELKRLIDKLHIKCYSAPSEFDFDIFKVLIETNNKNAEVTLIFNHKERSCKVVGIMDEVKGTYKWLIKISEECLVRNKQKPGKGSATDTNDDSRSNDKWRSAHQLDEPQSRSQRYLSDHKSDISDGGNKHGPFLDPKQQMTKSGHAIHISKSSKDKLEFTTRGNLRVLVYQGNMIKQPTEVIVNPANEHLAHGGGLPRVILDAGGPVIDVESRDIISKRGKLQTSEVVHTSAGKLPSPIKYVIHAVGPTAYEFKDNKAGLVPTMKVTFRNCLEYANNKLGVSSISLPPISSGIFAVPMPDIIQGAVEAIQDFDRKNPSAVLKEVHFISNDSKTTEDMISCFLNVTK